MRTRNSIKKILYRDTFTEDFVYMEKGAAEFLVARGIKTLGMDYLSVGGYKKNGPDVHRMLLGAGIIVIEGLDLTEALPGSYDMVCLPMKILDSDGAPARVIVKPLRHLAKINEAFPYRIVTLFLSRRLEL